MRKGLLALSAGGDRGAVLVGMLHGMYRAKGKSRVDWTQISGISAGAIVGSLVSQTIPENFDTKMEHAKDLFELGGFHVVQPHTAWGFYINAIDALWYYNSLYTSAPMKKLVEDNFNESLCFTPLTVGCYNKDTCEYETFREGLNEAIIASASVPIIFPSVKIGEHMYQDGALRHIIPVKEIFEFIDTHKSCVIDVCICYPINSYETFFKAMTPRGCLPLIEESFRVMTDQMLSTLNHDLKELAMFLGISFETIREKACNSFEKDGVVINIFSPDDASFTSFTNIKAEEMKSMYESGKRIIMEYLK
jgi:predicted acylesterase/phospholipase RssA